MAVLTAPQRAAVKALMMEDLSRAREAAPLTKAELQAAIDATDDWIDTNASAFNLALPVAARNGLTAAQKARLFSAVALKRFGG